MVNTAPNRILQEFIRRRRVDLTPEGTITRIELWHCIEGEAGDKLEVFDLQDRPEDEDPDDLCQEIWNSAEEDASTRASGSHQRYTVMVFRGPDREPEESKSFVIRGRALSALLGNDTEPPTPRGILAQQMRQDNDMHHLLMRVAEAQGGGLATQVRDMREEISRLYTERRQFFELEQQMMDRTHQRKLETLAQEKNAERIDALLQTAVQLAPLLLSRFLTPPRVAGSSPPAGGFPPPGFSPGGAPFPGAPSGGAPPDDFASAVAQNIASSMGASGGNAAAAIARDLAVKKLLENLDPAQLHSLMGSLSPEQIMQFMELYNSYRDDVAPSAASAPNPESSENQHAQN